MTYCTASAETARAFNLFPQQILCCHGHPVCIQSHQTSLSVPSVHWSACSPPPSVCHSAHCTCNISQYMCSFAFFDSTPHIFHIDWWYCLFMLWWYCWYSLYNQILNTESHSFTLMSPWHHLDLTCVVLKVLLMKVSAVCFMSVTVFYSVTKFMVGKASKPIIKLTGWT